jgi:hypothetical protein
MHPKMKCDECEKLRQENEHLRSKLIFLEIHPTIARGMRGEKIVAKITKYEKIEGNKSADLTNSILNLEVKYSKCTTANKGRPTKVWTWGKIFGTSGKKEYDRLFLVGYADPKYSKLYPDKDSPYVLFDLSYEDATEWAINGGTASKLIKITTNPNAAKSKEFIKKFCKTSKEIEANYDLE